jgi:hypothetical protein
MIIGSSIFRIVKLLHVLVVLLGVFRESFLFKKEFKFLILLKNGVLLIFYQLGLLEHQFVVKPLLISADFVIALAKQLWE